METKGVMVVGWIGHFCIFKNMELLQELITLILLKMEPVITELIEPKKSQELKT